MYVMLVSSLLGENTMALENAQTFAASIFIVFLHLHRHECGWKALTVMVRSEVCVILLAM
jgi:hypothetical protein